MVTGGDGNPFALAGWAYSSNSALRAHCDENYRELFSDVTRAERRALKRFADDSKLSSQWIIEPANINASLRVRHNILMTALTDMPGKHPWQSNYHGY